MARRRGIKRDRDALALFGADEAPPLMLMDENPPAVPDDSFDDDSEGRRVRQRVEEPVVASSGGRSYRRSYSKPPKAYYVLNREPSAGQPRPTVSAQSAPLLRTFRVGTKRTPMEKWEQYALRLNARVQGLEGGVKRVGPTVVETEAHKVAGKWRPGHVYNVIVVGNTSYVFDSNHCDGITEVEKPVSTKKKVIVWKARSDNLQADHQADGICAAYSYCIDRLWLRKYKTGKGDKKDIMAFIKHVKKIKGKALLEEVMNSDMTLDQTYKPALAI